MKLHIDSEVNPWPFGHLELNQIIIKPLEYQIFVYNQTKYQLFEGHLGELFSIVITFYDYDHPTWKINSTNERFPTIKTENYLLYEDEAANTKVAKSRRYIKFIKKIKNQVENIYNTVPLDEFWTIMKNITDDAIKKCIVVP